MTGPYRPQRRAYPACLSRRLRAAARLTPAALLLAVTACSGPAGPPVAQDRAGAGELRIVTGTDLTSTGVRRETIEDAADELGLDVRIIELSDDADRQRSQLVAALQAGNRDHYDIVNLDVTWTAEFAEQQLITPLEGDLAPLDPRGNASIWPSVRETVTYDGRAWAVPWNTDVGLLYYRADLLGETPRLATWQQLATTAARFERGEGGLSAGMVTQLDSYEGLTVNTHEAVWRNGGEIVAADGDVRVAEEDARDGLGELSNAFSARGSGLPLLDELSLHSGETASIEHFLAGRALTMRNWPFARLRLAEGLEKSDGGAPEQRYGVTALPGGGDGEPGHGVLGGQNLAVVADSPDREQARALIERITSRANGRRLYEGGFVPVRKDAVPGACAGQSAPLPGRVPRGGLEEQFRQALCWSMEHARARPATPYYGAVTQAVQDVMSTRLARAPQTPDAEADADPEDLRGRLEDALAGR